MRRAGVYYLSSAVTKSGRSFATERTISACDRAGVGPGERRFRGVEIRLRLLERWVDAAEDDVVPRLQAGITRRDEHADLTQADAERRERLRPGGAGPDREGQRREHDRVPVRRRPRDQLLRRLSVLRGRRRRWRRRLERGEGDDRVRAVALVAVRRGDRRGRSTGRDDERGERGHDPGGDRRCAPRRTDAVAAFEAVLLAGFRGSAAGAADERDREVHPVSPP